MAQLETKLLLRKDDRVRFAGSDSGYFWLTACNGPSFDDGQVTVHFSNADQVRLVRDAMTAALAKHDALQAALASLKTEAA